MYAESLSSINSAPNYVVNLIVIIAQESNSVLLRSLSRNRFSLGSMPVAKLKKSSKNPFKKAKADTSSATDRPRGRPRKVELE